MSDGQEFVPREFNDANIRAARKFKAERDALVRALNKIACRHVTEAPLWWQKEARDALDAVSTTGEPK